jgi:hypothetical protein
VDAKVTIGWALHPHLGAAPSVNGNGDVNVTKTMPVSSREQADLLGVPVLSPAYAFGLAPQTATVNQSNPAPPTPTGLKTIALVTASQRGDYNVRFAGTQTIDGAPCDVLELTPRGDPTLLRLRKLWIDEQTFATRQALLQGNFTAGPGPRLPWLVHFAQHDNLTYIEEEDALTPVHYLGKTYTNVSVRFSDVTASGPPDVTWRISMFRTSGDILREP